MKPDSMSLDHGQPAARIVYANLAEYRKAQAERWERIRQERTS